MGGRGTTGKTKLFTNIDADRNRPFREARTKEIEAERAAKRNVPPKASNKRIVQEEGTLMGSYYGKGEYRNNEQGIPVYVPAPAERRPMSSYARTGDGRLHASTSGRGAHTITDAASGLRVHTFDNKKDALSFLNAVTRRDGKTSPTMIRAIRYGTGEDTSAKNRQAAQALFKVIKRHDSARRRLESSPPNIKRKSL